jgi:hypothetical protein
MCKIDMIPAHKQVVDVDGLRVVGREGDRATNRHRHWIVRRRVLAGQVELKAIVIESRQRSTNV